MSMQSKQVIIEKQGATTSKRRFPVLEVLLILAVLGGLHFFRRPAASPPGATAPAPAAPPAELLVNKVAERTVEEEPAPPPAPSPLPSPAPEPLMPNQVAAPAQEPGSVPQEGPRASFEQEAALVLTGLDAQRENAVQRQQALLARAIREQTWNDYRKFLEKSITAGISKLTLAQGANRFDPIWNEPALAQALLRWQSLGWFPESAIRTHVQDAYSGELLLWLLDHNGAMEELLLAMKPEDDAAKVLGFLVGAWPNTSGKMDRYFPLALACALVFDREVGIPNPIGGSSTDGAVVDPMRRYLWYLNKNEKGQLKAPVHHSTARDLVWAVCAPVSESELEWSLDKMHLGRNNWGSAFGMIEYLMERAVEGLNPYQEYSFAEILKEGGICGDQSYFCANTARAQGIPAMILSGETSQGPHAWVGMKIQADEWTTGIGRVGGVSKGMTHDPQTGKPVTEQEVILWGDRAHQSPITTLAVARHLWLAGFLEATGDEAGAAAAILLANQLGPSFTETWAARFDLLKKQTKLEGTPAQPGNLEDWKAFAAALRREFKDNPRMAGLAAVAESEYIFPYAEEGDAGRALLRERRRIGRNAGEQADLIAESLKREADLILKRGAPTAHKEISVLYDRALREYGGSITGFKMMAADYFSFLKSDPELARKAARDIELAFKRVVETGTTDWFRAQTESSIYQMICDCYRAAGDEERAVMLEKRYQTLLKRAKRGAL